MRTVDELTTTSFIGPFVPQPKSKKRQQLVYLSLQHWYEAAKFMPHKPELRDAVLYAPTPKELRKFVRQRQDEWRSDWSLVRTSVLILGLALMADQCPFLELRTVDLSLIKEGLAPLGLPVRFVDMVLERFDAWRKGSSVALFGAHSAPETVVGNRLTKLIQPFATWTYVTPCNNKAAWRVHDWCLQHFIPVRYVGGPSERMSKPLITQIIDQADQLIVFEQRGARRQDAAIHAARNAGKKVSLELYDRGPVANLTGLN